MFLQKQRLYAFRLGIKENPFATPKPNEWVLIYNGDSGRISAGFTLWTFTGVSVDSVSTARSYSYTDAVKVQNPVTFQFKPFNQIHPDKPEPNSGGLIRITAPPAFAFAHVNFECQAFMEALPYNDEFSVSQPGKRWGQSDTNCRIDEADPRVLNFEEIYHDIDMVCQKKLFLKFIILFF